MNPLLDYYRKFKIPLAIILIGFIIALIKILIWGKEESSSTSLLFLMVEFCFVVGVSWMALIAAKETFLVLKDFWFSSKNNRPG